MNTKEGNRLASLVKKVAKAPEHLCIYAKKINFSENDLEFVKNHQKEFIEALNSEKGIIGIVQDKETLIDDLESPGLIWFEN
jgi:hypothetical protein